LYEGNGQEIWGLEIVKKTGLKTGTVYPILERLEILGWVTSQWEVSSERKGARRRTYLLTHPAIDEIAKITPTNAGVKVRGSKIPQSQSLHTN
jgi:DNA-binding PadR family transcriptional regulator